MKLKVFWKENCPNCPAAKRVAKELEKEGVTVEYCNIDEVDGLTEATFYDVLSTPSIVVVDDTNREIASFRGQAPSKEELKKHL